MRRMQGWAVVLGSMACSWLGAASAAAEERSPAAGKTASERTASGDANGDGAAKGEAPSEDFGIGTQPLAQEPHAVPEGTVTETQDRASGKKMAPWVEAWAASKPSREKMLLQVAGIHAIPPAERTTEQWLDLARGERHLGHLVEALHAYTQIAGPEYVPGVEDERDMTGRLMPWVTVTLSVPALSAPLYVDGELWGAEKLASPQAINPGWHTFLLEERGKITAAERVYIAEGRHERVQLTPHFVRPELTARPSPELSKAPLPIGAWKEPAVDGSSGYDGSLGAKISWALAAATAATAGFSYYGAYRAKRAMQRPCGVAVPAPSIEFSCRNSGGYQSAAKRFDRYSALGGVAVGLTLMNVAGAITFHVVEGLTGDSSTELSVGPGEVLLSGQF